MDLFVFWFLSLKTDKERRLGGWKSDMWTLQPIHPTSTHQETLVGLNSIYLQSANSYKHCIQAFHNDMSQSPTKSCLSSRISKFELSLSMLTNLTHYNTVLQLSHGMAQLPFNYSALSVFLWLWYYKTHKPLLEVCVKKVLNIYKPIWPLLLFHNVIVFLQWKYLRME